MSKHSSDPQVVEQKPEESLEGARATDDVRGEILSSEESRDLARLERVVTTGLDKFTEVGKALTEIRDRKLYRLLHRTFEDYCQDKWKVGRTYAHRLMAAAETTEMLPKGNKPRSERQVRPLTRLPKTKRVEAWERAVASSPTGQPSAKQVETAVRKIAPGNPNQRSVISNYGDLDTLLARRWKRFIADIAVTDHDRVRNWLTAKLKEAAL